MKKNFTYLLFASLIVSFLNINVSFGQSQVWASGYLEVEYAGPSKYPLDFPITWEHNDYVDYSFDAINKGTASIIKDPINNDNQVLQLSKPFSAGNSAGIKLTSIINRPVPFMLGGQNTLTVDVYSPKVGTTVNIRLENDLDPSVFVEVQVATTAANTWQSLVFDFDNPTPTSPNIDFAESYNIISVYLNKTMPPILTGETLFLDNFEFAGQSPNRYCNIGDSINVILHFFRDEFVDPANATQSITISSDDLGVDLVLALDSLFPLGRISQYCLSNTRVRTEGYLYRNKIPIFLPPSKDWKIEYQGQFRSPQNVNIPGVQEYYIETLVNNDKCGRVDGLINGIQSTRFNKREINTVEFIQNGAVASFVTNKTYNYTLPVVDTKDGDALSFELASAKTENSSSTVDYAQPAYPFDYPFPIKEPFLAFDKSTSRMTFTPTTRFTSVVTYQIDESRSYFQLDAGGTEIVRKDTVSSRTFYESRFIIDNDGAQNLPNFLGTTRELDQNSGQIRWTPSYNALENAQEFDCGSYEITFNLSEPLLCATVDRDDFRIAFTYNDISDLAAEIEEIYYSYVDLTKPAMPPKNVSGQCNLIEEFNQITFVLNKPLGPGRYNIFFRHGRNDNTTVKNKCDYELPINTPYVRLYINDDLTYNHPEDNYIYCNPADLSTAYATAYQRGEIAGIGKSFYTWRPEPDNPASVKDTVFPNTNIKKKDGTFYKIAGKNPDTNKQAYNVPGINPQKRGRGSRYRFDNYPESNPNPNVLSNVGVWEIGFGLDFSIYDPQTGALIQQSICYDTDRFTVTRYDNPEVNIPDFDLCPEDDWPLVNLDSMTNNPDVNISAIEDEFVFKRMSKTFSKSPSQSEIRNKFDWITVTSGRDKLRLPAQETDKYNVFATEVPLRVIVGQTSHTCYEKDTFIVVKTEVDASLRSDTILCPNEPIELVNEGEYLIPEKISFKWFFEGAEIPGETSDTLPTNMGDGEYKIEVIKSSEVEANLISTCSSKDSVRIVLADELDSSNIACRDVTFKDGQIVQNFNWDVVDGADGYEVRGILLDDTELPWEEANGLYGIQHEISGAQIRLEVRAYNNEVDKDASCRYGPITRAEACDINIRPVNVFTPNGDGINEFLSFTLLELYPGSRLQIFNRWGKLIYEDESYYNDWDGEDAKAGTYFYILEINDEEYPEPFKGSFTIIR